MRIPAPIRAELAAGLLAVGLFAVRSGGDPTPAGVHTVLQTGSPWTPGSHIATDLALVVGDESERGWKGAAQKVRSWRERGYRTYGFAAVSRVYDYYMRGDWTDVDGRLDPGDHEGEIQRDRWGGKFGPHEYMLLPTARLTEHKKLWARAFVDAGVEGMVFEEPDVFMDGGYSDQFRREWRAHYGEAWQPPESSIDARIKAEKLKAELGFSAYRTLADYSKARSRAQGRDLSFVVATHSLPNYLLWGVTFDYYRTLSLPTVDTLQAQVWTGTAKTPILHEGELRERLFDNAFLDYSYAVNLSEALGKKLILNLDPYEDEAGLPFEFYKRGFENTLLASLIFPQAKTWEILPWPDRIYTNRRIPPAYGTEIQHVVAAMREIGAERTSRWSTAHPRTGVLFSETALHEVRDPSPSNPQNLFALALPLLSAGVPVDVVPLEAAPVRTYLDRFRVLFLSYDSWKPVRPEVHAALAAWVRRGGTLVVIGGRSAYNEGSRWWKQQGCATPTEHLLRTLELTSGAVRLEPVRSSELRRLSADPPLQQLAAPFVGFWDGQHGVDPRPRPTSFVPDGKGLETHYLEHAIGPGGARPDLRYADASGFFTYRFATPGLVSLTVTADLANSYLVEASQDGKSWTELANSLEAMGRDVRDGSNRAEHTFDLTRYLAGKEVRLRFRDPSPRDGWGPTVRRLIVAPVYRGGAPAATELPLNHRDAYCCSYTGLKPVCRPAFATRAGTPVVFSAPVGKGRVFGIGSSPALFGSSRHHAEALRSFYRTLCAQRGLRLEADGVLHLTRGSYHLVQPISRPARLKGRFLDILSPDLEVRTDPALPVGRPNLLRALPPSALTGRPRVLFASHRSTLAGQTADGVRFRMEGPEGIPAVARLWIGRGATLEVEARRVTGGTPVPCFTQVDPDGTARLRVDNVSGGLEIAVMVRPGAS